MLFLGLIQLRSTRSEISSVCNVLFFFFFLSLCVDLCEKVSSGFQFCHFRRVVAENQTAPFDQMLGFVQKSP